MLLGFLTAVAGAWVVLLVLSPLGNWLIQNEPREALRTVSFMAYFFLLHRALTRV